MFQKSLSCYLNRPWGSIQFGIQPTPQKCALYIKNTVFWKYLALVYKRLSYSDKIHTKHLF